MNALLPQEKPRSPDAESIDRFRERPGVWLTFAGLAAYDLYRSRLVPIGLKPSWVTALAIIEQRPNITQSALGRDLCVNRASAMATSTQLESAGLILRTPLQGRNQTGLSITAEGRRRLDDACQIEESMMEALLKGISGRERKAFVDLLRTVASRASRMP
jgi:DNA-binding MarR family transcriptional regulator